MLLSRDGKIIRTQHHILDLFTYKVRANVSCVPSCVLASCTDSEVVESQTSFNVYSVHAWFTCIVAGSPLPNIWYHLVLPAQNPLSCSAQVCDVYDFQSKKSAVDDSYVTFLTVFILLTASVVCVAIVWQVDKQ